jgi:hypothetical protein
LPAELGLGEERHRRRLPVLLDRVLDLVSKHAVSDWSARPEAIGVGEDVGADGERNRVEGAGGAAALAAPTHADALGRIRQSGPPRDGPGVGREVPPRVAERLDGPVHAAIAHPIARRAVWLRRQRSGARRHALRDPIAVRPLRAQQRRGPNWRVGAARLDRGSLQRHCAGRHGRDAGRRVFGLRARGDIVAIGLHLDGARRAFRRHDRSSDPRACYEPSENFTSST